MIFKRSKKGMGAGGLGLFLTLISMVFFIGMLVMCLALVGASMISATTDATAIDAINDTVVAVSAVPGNWFAIFITIGAVVAILAMLVIVYALMRNSGMTGGGA